MDDPIGYDFSVPGMNTLKSFYYNGCSLIELQTLIINQKLNTYFNNLYLSRVCKLRRLKSYSKDLQFNLRDAIKTLLACCVHTSESAEIIKSRAKFSVGQRGVMQKTHIVCLQNTNNDTIKRVSKYLTSTALGGSGD